MFFDLDQFKIKNTCIMPMFDFFKTSVATPTLKSVLSVSNEQEKKIFQN
jgi:hypothetical protein